MTHQTKIGFTRIERTRPNNYLPQPSSTPTLNQVNNPTYISCDLFDKHHVKLPFSKHNTNPNGSNRWPTILKALEKLSSKGDLVVLKDVEDCYNTLHGNSNDIDNGSKCSGLISYLINKPSYLKLLPLLAKLALRVVELFPLPIPLLSHHHQTNLTFTNIQIGCILSCSLFLILPHRTKVPNWSEYSNFPTINFNWLVSCKTNRHSLPSLLNAKWDFLFNYFQYITQDELDIKYIIITRNQLKESLTTTEIYERLADQRPFKVIPSNQLDIIIKKDGLIEDTIDQFTKVDFANKIIGGGVLNSGAVQEEILFLIYPELLMTRLINPILKDDECIIVKGILRCSDYKGYGETLSFNGNVINQHLNSGQLLLDTEFICIDAINFGTNNPIQQFRPNFILREFNKCYIGYLSSNQSLIATGLWGCGVFKGDSHLKIVIQILAYWLSNKSQLVIFTFDNQELVNDFQPFLNYLKQNDVNLLEFLGKLISFFESLNLTNNSSSHLNHKILGIKLLKFLMD